MFGKLLHNYKMLAHIGRLGIPSLLTKSCIKKISSATVVKPSMTSPEEKKTHLIIDNDFCHH